MKISRRAKWLMITSIIYLVVVFTLSKEQLFVVQLVWVVITSLPLYIKPLGRYIFTDE